jgi:hypothetical protein
MTIAPLTSALRILGVILMAQALMLLGADEITSIEHGWVRIIRSFGEILALYHAGPGRWMNESLPGWLATPLMMVLAAPGWAVFGLTGALLVFIARERA